MERYTETGTAQEFHPVHEATLAASNFGSARNGRRRGHGYCGGEGNTDTSVDGSRPFRRSLSFESESLGDRSGSDRSGSAQEPACDWFRDIGRGGVTPGSGSGRGVRTTPPSAMGFATNHSRPSTPSSVSATNGKGSPLHQRVASSRVRPQTCCTLHHGP